MVIFAAAYATAMALAALGIDWAGRVSARRRPGAPPDVIAESTPPWPHNGSIAVHTVVAAVAALAGVLVAVVTALGHHDGADVSLLAIPALLAAATLRRLHARLRAAAQQ